MKLLGYRIKEVSTGRYRTPVHKRWTRGEWASIEHAKIFKTETACKGSLYGHGYARRLDDGTIIRYSKTERDQYIKENYEFIPVYEA